MRALPARRLALPHAYHATRTGSSGTCGCVRQHGTTSAEREGLAVRMKQSVLSLRSGGQQLKTLAPLSGRAGGARGPVQALGRRPPRPARPLHHHTTHLLADLRTQTLRRRRGPPAGPAPLRARGRSKTQKQEPRGGVEDDTQNLRIKCPRPAGAAATAAPLPGPGPAAAAGAAWAAPWLAATSLSR